MHLDPPSMRTRAARVLAGAGAVPPSAGSSAIGLGGTGAAGNLGGSAGTTNGGNGNAFQGVDGGVGNAINGGGGGAGLAGGGGGNETVPAPARGGGGGGGSSSCIAQATCTSETVDMIGGAPQVKITYTKLATVTTAGAPAEHRGTRRPPPPARSGCGR